MANLGYVSTFNINGNELSLKDAALTEIVEEIIEAIGANNGDISERINNLHDRSFDALIKISSQNESEISNVQDGMYKIQYVTVTGEGDNTTETLNNSAILIQNGANQYLYKDGQISSRTKTNSTWGSWITFEGGVTSVNGMTGAVTLSIPNDSNLVHKTGNETIEGNKWFKSFYISINGTGDIKGTVTIDDMGGNGKIILTGDDYPWAQIQSGNETLQQALDARNNLVTSVNGMTGAVTVNVPVTSVNGQTGAVTITHPVTSVNGATGAVSLALGDTNVIETVKVNNTALTPTSKAVNITVPTKVSDLTNDSGFITSAPVTSVNGQTGVVNIIIPTTSTTVSQNDNNPVSGGAVYAKFEDLIGSAPAALDTLGEIAAALNNDADLAGTLTNQIAGKISKVSPATAGNFASLNSDGTLSDSGHKHSDYLTEAPVTSVNGMTGTVTITHPVTSVNGMTGAVNINVGVTSFNGSTGAVTYTPPITSVNGQTGAVAIDVGVTSFNGATGAVTYTAPVTSVNGMTGAVVLPEGGVTSFNGATGAVTYTAPVSSVNGQTGAVSLALGDTNVIETVKVNNSALIPVNKAVNITIPTKVSDLTNDSGFTSNAGTITSISMNGVTKGTSGAVDLGTVLTSHQDISGKVDKVTGMGLSTNDYTTAEKNKLAGINIGSLDSLTTTELNSIFS